MSFNTQVKNELLKISVKNPCCKTAMAYGLLLFSRGFSSNDIHMQTEKIELAEHYALAISNILGEEVYVDQMAFSNNYSVNIVSASQRTAILDYFNFDYSSPNLRINFDVLKDECCYSAFLRGVFLACGVIINPEKYYMIEFLVLSQQLTDDLKYFLDNLGFFSKITHRKDVKALYFTSSEQIEDLLTYMGAQGSSLKVMDIKIVKSLRNITNRKTNCETANIGKTVNASTKQLYAIKSLMAHNMFLNLKPTLKDAADLRLLYPDATLSELCKLAGISKSGLNHRFSLIIEIADNLEKNALPD